MLKQLLQRLLNSRTTPAQSMSYNNMDLIHIIGIAWSGQNTTSFTAPSDGYANIWMQAGSPEAKSIGCDIVVNEIRLPGSAIKTTGMEAGLFIPVASGDNIRFGKWGADNVAQMILRFIPKVGASIKSA